MFQTDETLCSMLMNHVVSSACTFCSVLMEQACVLYEMTFVTPGFFVWVGEKCGEWGARFHGKPNEASGIHNSQIVGMIRGKEDRMEKIRNTLLCFYRKRKPVNESYKPAS